MEVFQKVSADSLSFDEQVLSAAMAIASAVQLLVKAASAAQRELVAQGRLVSSGCSFNKKSFKVVFFDYCQIFLLKHLF